MKIDFFIDLCDFLYNYLNKIIIGLAFVELILFVISLILLVYNRTSFKNLLAQKITVADKEKDQSNYREQIIRETKVDQEVFNQKLNNYQLVTCVWYSVFSLIIQLFTLLGILGTVAGLFSALQNWKDLSKAQEMYDKIGFALSSTVLGLIFALLFKLGDIFLSSVFINYIDEKIDRFEKKFAEADIIQKGKSID